VILTGNLMISDEPRTVFVILGPTGVGKTSLSIRLAQKLSTAIISADSRQFYREMRIGTARPSREELQAVTHYLVGHLSIYDDYNVSKFEAEAIQLLNEIFRNKRTALITGGSGLYIKALCEGIDVLPDPDPTIRENLDALFSREGLPALRSMLKKLDPDFYETVDKANPKRLLRALEVCIATGLPYSSLRKSKPAKREFRIVKIGLYREKAELYNRINMRVDRMMQEGLLDEAKELFPHRHLNALNTVGYKELFACLEGSVSLEEAVEKIKTNSRRYAKRQMTWFRKEEGITWFDASREEDIILFALNECNK
jgi:tRNA dimethylallyltransferase